MDVNEFLAVRDYLDELTAVVNREAERQIRRAAHQTEVGETWDRFHTLYVDFRNQAQFLRIIVVPIGLSSRNVFFQPEISRRMDEVARKLFPWLIKYASALGVTYPPIQADIRKFFV